jgi:hypothetical protein
MAKAVLHTKNTGIVSEKIDHENIFVGDALKIAKAIIPYSITKKEKLQQVIDHYGNKT